MTWTDGSGGETLPFARSRAEQTVHVPEQLPKDQKSSTFTYKYTGNLYKV